MHMMLNSWIKILKEYKKDMWMENIGNTNNIGYAP